MIVFLIVLHDCTRTAASAGKLLRKLCAAQGLPQEAHRFMHQKYAHSCFSTVLAPLLCWQQLMLSGML